MIKVAKLSEDAKIPTRGSDAAAGLDLYTVDSVTIPSGKRAILSTDISMEIPEGHVGLIWPRSKLAGKHGIAVLAGVIDSDYRGEIMISLLNTGEDPMELRKGDKVAQMIIQRHYSDLPLIETTQLNDTDRGNSGINSSEMRLRD